MKVSVIIPTYNRKSYLLNAIDSVMNQTFKDYEIVVVDDGSTDGTKEALALLVNSNLIKYYYQINGGPSKARNLGIKQAQGEYIAFLDSDDLWLPTKLEAQMEYLRLNPTLKVVHSNIAIIKNGKLDERDLKSRGLLGAGWLFEKILLLKGWILLSTLMVHRTVIEKVGIFDESLGTAEDTNLILRIAKEYEIGFVEEVLVNRLVHDANISLMKPENNGTIDSISKIEKLYPELAISNKDLFKQAYEARYFFIAKTYFYLGDYRRTREKYIKSLKYNHLRIKTIALIICTLFPKRLIDLFRKTRRILLNKINKVRGENV